MIEVKRTERGWGGHFICVESCLFRRNTLLEAGDVKIVVSTVGNMLNSTKDGEIGTIGYMRYFETMAFHSDAEDAEFHDIDMERQVRFASPWELAEPHMDNEANDMHEAVVAELMDGLAAGNHYEASPTIPTSIPGGKP